MYKFTLSTFYRFFICKKQYKTDVEKRKEKTYVSYSGFPGGRKEVTFEELLAKKPEEIVRHAVKGMLPDGKLGRQMFKKLHVYTGPEHKHAAQKPEALEF